MKVGLVLHAENRGWILEKFAVRLAENLAACGVEAGISDTASASADLNHWLLYMYYDGGVRTPATALITHIDQFGKLRRLKAALATLNAGICLSRMTVETLVRRGAPRDKLCYVIPAHDGLVKPKRIRIGITSRVYGDGRKREDMLVALAQTMRLDRFHFDILGDGWDQIIPRLEAAGATVHYDRGSTDYQQDYARALERIPTFDYYLYTGLDEGSMGFLDALAAGVSTIVTPQGFHLDVAGGITHPFTDLDELAAVFATISSGDARRTHSVAGLTWARYARHHALIWRAVLDGRPAASALEAEQEKDPGTPGWQPQPPSLVEDLRFYSRPIVGRLKRIMKRRSSE